MFRVSRNIEQRPRTRRIGRADGRPDPWCPEKRRFFPIATLAGGVGFETLAFDSQTVDSRFEMDNFSMNFQLSFPEKFKFDQD